MVLQALHYNTPFHRRSYKANAHQKLIYQDTRGEIQVIYYRFIGREPLSN